MSLFTSSREKKLWLYALLVWLTILSSLFLGYPLLKLLGNENMQTLIFLICMSLIGAAIILHAFRRASDKNETVTILGIVAVFLMLFLRLGLDERTHLMEYAVLTVFIHRALIERYRKKYKGFKIAVIALVLSFFIGVFDECVQILIPNRVFDFQDFLFNGLAAGVAVVSSFMWKWIRNIFIR